MHSQPGQGSTFEIYLPHLAAEESVPAARPPERAGPSPGREETVLFVEDEEVVRQLMVLTLRGQGYRVLEAAGGAEALQVAAQHPDPIHLLVADVVMPKMNGKELAERLAALRSGVKVLYVSGYAEGIIAQRGGLASLEAFLRKPFTAEELSAKVRQVLDTGAGPTPGQRRHRGKAGSPPGDPDHG